MMVRQAKAQRNGSVQALGAGGAEVRELRERLLLERSALLEQAAEQVEGHAPDPEGRAPRRRAGAREVT